MSELLTHLLNASPDAFLLANLDQANFVYVNPAFEQLWQVSWDNLRQEPGVFLRTIHLEDLPKAEQFLAAMRNREEKVTELRLRGTGSAVRCWVELRIVALSGNETIAGLQGRDITLQKEQEIQHRQALDQVMSVYEDLSNHQEELKASLEEVRLSNQQLDRSRGEIASIIQNASEAICTLDNSGKILSMNSAGMKLFRLKENQFIYQYLVNLVAKIHRKDVAGFLLGYHDAPPGEPPVFRMEMTMQRTTKEEFPGQLSLSRVEGMAGAGFVAIVTDLSEIRKREEELQRAQQEAEQAVATKSQFLSNMSHEIRTPLNAVIGMTNLLLDDQLPGAQRQKLDTIKFSADNLLAIINNILDLSKIEAGNVHLEKKPFQLTALLGNVLSMFRHRATEKDLDLRLEGADELPEWVIGDPHQLSQILTNLLGNAVKFTQYGHVCLRLKNLGLVDDCIDLLIQVEDTGMGIATEKQQLIFERFTQAGIEISHLYGGTGLGLAIVKKLVNLHGGNIKVVSEPGRGAIFEFNLKYLIGQAPAIEHIPISSLGPKWLAGQHILVAEDNQVNQLVISQYLQKWGGRVTLALNGREALACLAKEKADLLLLDLNMPEMNGFEVAHAIRTSPEDLAARLPIIVLTADISLEIARRTREVGMDGVLTKPFQPTELQAAIAACLRLGQSVGDIPPKESIATVQSAPLIDLSFLAHEDPRNSRFAQEFIRLNLIALTEFSEQYATTLRSGQLAAYQAMRHHLTSNLVLLHFDQLKLALSQGEELMVDGLPKDKEESITHVQRLCLGAVKLLEKHPAA